MAPRTEPKTLAEARQVAALSVPTAARLIGVSPSKLYQAVATGQIPAVRVCGRVLICAPAFLAMFGVESEVGSVVASATSSLDPSGARECTSCPKGSK